MKHTSPWSGILMPACAVTACLVAHFSDVSAATAGRPVPVSFRTQTMGTWATLTVVAVDSSAVADIARRSLSTLHRVDSLMSNWTETSEVARINRNTTAGSIKIHPEVAAVLERALRIGRDSGGAFDVTIEPLVRLWGFLGGIPHVPQQSDVATALQLVGQNKLRLDAGSSQLQIARDGVRIDLGGVAKGYGVDRAAAVLRRANVNDALMDLSGNMVAMGNAATHKGWAVGIRDPSRVHPYLARVHLYDEAVATSGNYEQFVDVNGRRYGHILDPRTGWPAGGLSSVTVVCEHALDADAWATALFVLGSEKARRLAKKRDDLAVVLIEPGNGGVDIIWVEEALRDQFELRDDLANFYSVTFF